MRGAIEPSACEKAAVPRDQGRVVAGVDVAAAQKLAENERLSAKERQENCAQVQGQLTQLGAENLALWRVNANGERVPMTSAERRAERDRLAKWFRDNKCQG